MNANSTVLVHSDRYADWVLGSNHPTQGRRFINARRMFEEAMNSYGTRFTVLAPRLAQLHELQRTHSNEYIDQVLKENECHEWAGQREDLAQLASLFVGGTLVALETLINLEAKTSIHFPGAKHHAQYSYSSGFCVFADFAIAADIASNDYNKRIAILDFDAHHGDGTENLTLDNPRVLTFSIHQYGIFPGTGDNSVPEKLAFNYPLFSQLQGHDPGREDEALFRGVEKFINLARDFEPDLLFVASGADGHMEDPLSSLAFTVTGIETVGKMLVQAFPSLPILIGGAGGYLPDTRTPEVWSRFAATVANR